MTNAIVAALIGLVLGCSLPGPAQGQKASPKQSGDLNFELFRGEGVPQGAVDSFLTIEARTKAAAISVAFNNPCQVRPSASYTTKADTLVILFDHKPHLAR